MQGGGSLPNLGDSRNRARRMSRSPQVASFVRPLTANRSQIYSEMTMDDFIKNLNVYQEESLK